VPGSNGSSPAGTDLPVRPTPICPSPADAGLPVRPISTCP